MSLIHVDVDYIHAASPYNSADGACFVAGKDGMDYVAKLPTPDAPNLPAAESIAYSLSARLGIAVPASAWLKFEDGRLGYGSRWEAGVQQFTRLDVDERQQAFLACKIHIARFCLLDAFLANPDRHADNLLFRRSPFDNRWTVINIDFSRALWRGGFPGRTPRETIQSGNTGATAHLLLALQSFEATMMMTVTASLGAISGEQVAAMIAEIPDAARDDAVNKLPEWWESQARLDRVAELQELFK
jgi:hypothetical protein